MILCCLSLAKPNYSAISTVCLASKGKIKQMDADTLDTPKARAIGRTLSKAIGPRLPSRRYLPADLLKPEDVTPPPRKVIDGFDAWGQPREFEPQQPTREAVSQDKHGIEGPENSRTAVRLFHRRKSLWEFMRGRETITDAHVKAGDKLTSAIAVVEFGAPNPDGKGGTGEPEPLPLYRLRCSDSLRAAERLLGSIRYGIIKDLALCDLDEERKSLTTEDIGYRLGARSKRTAYRHGGTAVAEILQELAELWGFTERPSRNEYRFTTVAEMR